MEGLEVSPPLQGVLEGLSREVTGVAIASSIRRQLQQAQSPLSLVRQDAYASLAASLDLYLRDPARAGAVLPALGRVWPELLQSIALGLRQAGAGADAAARAAAGAGGAVLSPGAAAALAYRGVSHGELTAMVRVLELACLLALPARESSLAAGLLPLLLAQLPAAPPALACAAMDAVLAVQLRHPAAFVSFAEQGGLQQICQLLKDQGTSEPVRSHAVQFLNLLLTQLVPELLPPDALPASPSPTTTPGSLASGSPDPRPSTAARGGSGGGGSGGGMSHLDAVLAAEEAAAVLAALEGAKAAVGETLGREARAMLLRRVALDDVSAEAKLGQLSSALTLFIESDA